MPDVHDDKSRAKPGEAVAGCPSTPAGIAGKELLPGKLKEYAAIRQSRENKAEKAGIEIDSSYQDPTIQALK